MLCGDGVRGCHGLVELHDAVTLHRLARHLQEERPDVIAYLGSDWVARLPAGKRHSSVGGLSGQKEVSP